MNMSKFDGSSDYEYTAANALTPTCGPEEVFTDDSGWISRGIAFPSGVVFSTEFGYQGPEVSAPLHACQDSINSPFRVSIHTPGAALDNSRVFECIRHNDGDFNQGPSIHVAVSVGSPWGNTVVLPCKIVDADIIQVKSYSRGGNAEVAAIRNEEMPRSYMLLVKATDNDVHSFLPDSSVCHLRQDSIQAWILCGQTRVEVWIQIYSSFPRNAKWPSQVDWNNGMPEFGWLSDNEMPSFIQRDASKGLHIVSGPIKPAEVIDWTVMQRHSSGTNRPAEMEDDSKDQVTLDRPWTKEEESILILLRKQKKSFVEIARNLGREEFDVASKYVEIVPLPRSASAKKRGPINQVYPEPSRMLFYILWGRI